jgi:hypothetical protein
MPRIISLSPAIILLLTGVASLVSLLAFADEGGFWMFMGSGLLIVAGAVWLYSDLVEEV